LINARNERQVDPKEVIEWVEKRDCVYIETSAKSGKNVSLIFETAIREIYFYNSSSFLERKQKLEKKKERCISM